MNSKNEYIKTVNPMLADILKNYEVMSKSSAAHTSQVYKQTINRYVNNLMSDTSEERLSAPSMMRKAIRELTSEGISFVDYDSGRTMRMDTAVRTAFMNEFTNIVSEVQHKLADEIGMDGVEITVEYASAEDHADVQGRVFTNEEYEKLQNLEVATDIDGVQVQIGSKRPIGMWNCCHMAMPFMIGVSERNFSPEKLEKINKRNDDGIVYNGERISIYSATQEQRRLETEMRRTREDLNFYKKLRDSDPLIEHEYQKSRKRLAELRSEYHVLGNKLKPLAIREKMERSYVPRGSMGNALNSPKEKLGLLSNPVSINPLRDININELAMSNKSALLLSLGKEDGKERMSVMNKGGTEKGLFGGSSSKIPMTTRLFDTLYFAPDNSIVVLHNHPSSNSFSLDDFKLMLKFHTIREIRAIGHNNNLFSVGIRNGKRITYIELVNFIKINNNVIIDNYFENLKKGIVTSYRRERNIFIAKEFGWSYSEGIYGN